MFNEIPSPTKAARNDNLTLKPSQQINPHLS